MSASQIVNKVSTCLPVVGADKFHYAHVLPACNAEHRAGKRDDGVGYGDYVEQITYIIFLRMADERETTGQQVQVPNKYAWAKLVKLDGDDLEQQYRHTLESLGKEGGMLSAILQ